MTPIRAIEILNHVQHNCRDTYTLRPDGVHVDAGYRFSEFEALAIAEKYERERNLDDVSRPAYRPPRHGRKDKGAR